MMSQGYIPNFNARIKLPEKQELEFQDFWKNDPNVKAWKIDLGNPRKSPDSPFEKLIIERLGRLEIDH